MVPGRPAEDETKPARQAALAEGEPAPVATTRPCTRSKTPAPEEAWAGAPECGCAQETVFEALPGDGHGRCFGRRFPEAPEEWARGEEEKGNP